MAAVMGLSFAVNFLLLRGTEQLSMDSVGIGRLLTASLLGTAYAGACMLPGFRFLRGTLWRFVSLAGTALLAFGFQKNTWRQSSIFILLTMALGGAAMAVGRGEKWMLLVYALLIRLLGRFAFGASRHLLPVEISGNGKSVQLTALLDTGNELRDPITGERVLVVDARTAEELAGLCKEQLREPLATMASEAVPGLRLIPYQAVGAERGMLLAMRFPSIRIGGRDRAGLVAFAPQELGGKSYQALAGGFV